MKRSELRRSPFKHRENGLPPGESLKRGKKLKPVSDKRRAEAPERDLVRAAVFKRDSHKCRIAPFLPDLPCHGPLTYHHLRKEGQGGAYTEANGISACSYHNEWVENFPIEADALGLVIHPDLRGEGMDESTVGPQGLE